MSSEVTQEIIAEANIYEKAGVVAGHVGASIMALGLVGTFAATGESVVVHHDAVTTANTATATVALVGLLGAVAGNVVSVGERRQRPSLHVKPTE